MRKRVMPEKKVINSMLLDGGVGDHIASLVAIDYIYNRYPWIIPLNWMPDYMVEFAKHVLPKNAIIKGYSDMPNEYNSDLTTKSTKWDGIVSPMKIHCLDYAFLKLCDENPSIDNKNYLSIRPNEIDISDFNLPEKYVVITAGYTAKAREFPAKEINKISKYVKSKGYEVVFLGQTKTQTGIKHVIEGNFDKALDFSIGVNLLNKTTLLEAAKIISNSAAIVGVDNGLLHLAGCTETAIIGGFTSVTPGIRMPVRHNILGWNYYPVTPIPEMGCDFCQERTNFLYGHDYRNCIYKDDLCVQSMKAEKFIRHLKAIL